MPDSFNRLGTVIIIKNAKRHNKTDKRLIHNVALSDVLLEKSNRIPKDIKIHGTVILLIT